jgi:hypothetical protein
MLNRDLRFPDTVRAVDLRDACPRIWKSRYSGVSDFLKRFPTGLNL